MPTIEMSLHRDYVPEWNVWSGLRELAQNCIDGDKELGAAATIRYRKESGCLYFQNEGITIPREALLIGYSTKRNNNELSGQFGEGLNLGLLALIREGLNVVIRNGSEVWRPFLERSEKFDAEVLKMKIRKGGKDYRGLQIEVRRVADEDWELFRKCLLFVCPPKEEETIATPTGSILKGEEYRGMVFVKGIFVERMPDIDFGYDLKEGKVDRDRKMIDKYDVKWKMSMMWAHAMNEDKTRAKNVYSLLEKDSDEVKDLHYLSHYMPDHPIAEEFIERHCAECIPVRDLAQSREIEHFGKKGAVVSKSLSQVLALKFGDFDKIKNELYQQPQTLLSWDELTTEEQHNLETIIEMVNRVVPLTLDRINIAEFRDDKTLGKYIEGKILLARNILLDLNQLLATVVHEYQHENGGDAEWGFHYSVEELLAKIAIKNWRQDATN